MTDDTEDMAATMKLLDLAAERKRRDRKADPYCETDAANEIAETVDLARRTGFMAAIVGDPGVGKTTALLRYVEHEAGVVLCTMTPAQSSMSSVFSRLYHALAGHEIQFPSSHAAYVEIVGWMEGRIEVLLIDEAQHVNDRSLDALRSIHDATRVPIVFVGNADLRSRFGNVKKAGFGQFLSRIGPRLDLGPSAEAITALALQRGANIAAANWLVARAAGKGNLRTVDLLMRAARANGAGETVNRADLERAAILLGDED